MLFTAAHGKLARCSATSRRMSSLHACPRLKMSVLRVQSHISSTISLQYPSCGSGSIGRIGRSSETQRWNGRRNVLHKRSRQSKFSIPNSQHIPFLMEPMRHASKYRKRYAWEFVRSIFKDMGMIAFLFLGFENEDGELCVTQ